MADLSRKATIDFWFAIWCPALDLTLHTYEILTGLVERALCSGKTLAFQANVPYNILPHFIVNCIILLTSVSHAACC